MPKEAISMIKRQSQGFSVLAALAILLVVAAVGTSGWFVWHKHQQASITSKAKDNPSQATNNQQTEQNPKTTDPSEGGKYLVISEWDMKIPLTNDLQNDVKYGLFTFTSGDQAVYFTSKKLVSHGPGGSCDLVPRTDSSGQGISGGTIAVSRSTIKPEENVGSSFVIGSYWYTLSPSNGGACFDGDTGQEKGTFKLSMESAIKKLVPLK
jgi:hypothetical protein